MIANPNDGHDRSRYETIARRERATTMASIDAMPPELHADILGLWLAIQEATNAYIAREDRVLDERVLPATLALVADEVYRIARAARVP